MLLALTSKSMHDAKANGPIHQLQKALAGANPFKINFHPGAIDGVYGPATASAVKRAKYRLGFPTVNNKAGDTFFGIITGKQAWPVAYRALAWKRRQQAAARATVRDKAFATAVSQIGVKESPPGTNHVKYNDWYYGHDVRGPWCAVFVTWCYITAGSKAFDKGARYAYVPNILHDAVNSEYGLSITTEPVKGDLVLYDWDHDGVCDHVGLFEGWHDSSHDGFTAVEGNTDKGNNSNGGAVQERKDRVRSETRAFVRVSK